MFSFGFCGTCVYRLQLFLSFIVLLINHLEGMMIYVFPVISSFYYVTEERYSSTVYSYIKESINLLNLL